MRQSYADRSAVSDGYRDGDGAFSNSDLNGYGYSYRYSYGAYTDCNSDIDNDACCFSDSDGNGNRLAHAAAHPDAETGTDSGRAYRQLLAR